ncbi:hypothetical protein SAZ11_00205 [Streptomyces sp. FXJ1.4098]|nr:hypothetical protein [Streptomyces sp. FXJ1.4098]
MSTVDFTKDEDGTGPVTADGMMPLWAVSLGWELRRGRQVILNGQIRDRWWFEDRPATFRELVAGVLEVRGADVVGWWDPVAGLTFPLPGHAERFAQLEADRPHTATRSGGRDTPTGDRQAGDRQAGDRQAGDRQGDAGQQDNPRSRRGSERERDRSSLLSPRRAGPPRAFDDVLATVHRIVASSDAATAFVFQDVDHHLPPGQPESNLGYLRLRAAMTDAVTPARPWRAAARTPVTPSCARWATSAGCPAGSIWRTPGSPPCTSAHRTRASAACG